MIRCKHCRNRLDVPVPLYKNPQPMANPCPVPQRDEFRGGRCQPVMADS